MRISLYIIILFFIKSAFANEITIIELHNKSIDQVLIENSENENNQQSKQEIITEDIQNDKDSINLEEKLKIIEEIDETLNTYKVEELNNIWQDINKEEILYLVNNINKIHSSVLKNEIISTLSATKIVPNEFIQEEFDRFLINSLLKLGDRKKAYEIIQSIDYSSDNINDSFYKQFTLNYLLSTYNLSEACNYRESIKDLDLNSKTNFFLKIDIFCLILEEKFDQANLLNALLIETETIQDDYFQFLLSKLIGSILKKFLFRGKFAILCIALYKKISLELSEKITFSNSFSESISLLNKN